MKDTNDQFLMNAYCGLVLRGYDRERDIPDSILRQVWRRGKALFIKTRKRSKS